MTTLINRFIKRLEVLVLLATLLWIAGCATPDPLAGWQPDFHYRPGDQAIENDYHDYIQHLPAEDREGAGPFNRFEDGTGQHAVVINIGINGTHWKHVLIYDKDNKRIKTIKYVAGHYGS